MKFLNLFGPWGLVLFSFFFSVSSNLQAQERPILTGAPFLRIAPDARSGGMADIGVASTTDAFSQYWNPSKYLFSNYYSGIGLSFTPVLSNITNDVFLINAAYHTYMDQDQRSALGVSIYYFNLGEVQLTELGVGGVVQETGLAKPNEFAIDVSYGLKLSDTYGMAVALRYIRSDIFNNDGSAQTKAASSFAVDVNGYLQTEEHTLGNIEGRLRAGFNIKNIGPKLDYTSDDDNANYLPTNLGLGGGYDFLLNDDNKLALNLEFNKLLVPTPTTAGTVPDEGVIQGMFSSFTDAPGGFSEELKEITYGVGAEYVYKDAFSGRLGYFHESKDKGARQFISMGAGFKYSSFGVDLSYLIPTISINNALEGTLRFSLVWNFGGEVTN